MSEYFRLLKYVSKYKNRFFIGILLSLTASILNAISLSALMPIFQSMLAKNKNTPFQLTLNQKDIVLLKNYGYYPRLEELSNKLDKLNRSENKNILSSQQKSHLEFLPQILEKKIAIAKLNINEFSSKFDTMEFLILICGFILPLYLLKLLSIMGTIYFITSIGLLAVRDVRRELYGKLIELPLTHFIREKTGVLMSRIINDVTLISDSLSQRLRVSIINLFIIITHFIMLALIDYELVLVCLIGVPMALWPVNHFSRKIRRITSGEQSAMGDLNAHLQELITGIRVVRAFGMEDYQAGRFKKLNDYMYHQTFKYHLNHTLGPSLVEFVTSFVVVGLLLYGTSRILSSEMSPGGFFTFLFTLIVILSPIKQIATWINEIRRTSAAGERIFQIIDTETEVRDAPGLVKQGKLKKKITFKKVSFTYPESDMQVLKNIDLEVRVGDTLALVGHSGAGKSTLVDLIPRFYEVMQGGIFFDGINTKDISLKNIREKIGIVTQEIFLVNGSIRENICFGRKDIQENDMFKAAEQAYAWEFIKKLPDKYETFIGERGMLLSGGQKQRISIARALLKNPEILILDEATSSLDSHSEKLVQKALSRLMGNRTTFVIAHRLSTIYEANKIIVLESGRIVEQGTHKELLKKKGAYYKFYNIQFKT